MNRIEFVNQVMHLTGIKSPEVAQQSTSVVLNLLRHRLSPAEAKNIATYLTDDLKELWDPEDFFTKIINLFRQDHFNFSNRPQLLSVVREELKARDLDADSEQLTAAVFHLLKLQTSAEESRVVARELPQELGEFWATA